MSNLDVFEFPAFAEMRSDVVVGFFVVGETQVRAIPEELLIRETPTDGTEQHPFGIGSGDAEV